MLEKRHGSTSPTCFISTLFSSSYFDFDPFYLHAPSSSCLRCISEIVVHVYDNACQLFFVLWLMLSLRVHFKCWKRVPELLQA